MNKKLIAKVIQSIVDQPEKHEQESWVRVAAPHDTFGEVVIDPEVKLTLKGEVPISNLLALEGSCETTACIAGWTLLHEGYVTDASDLPTYGNVRVNRILSPHGDKFTFEDIGLEAANRLGLWDQPFGQLFYDMNEESALAQLMFLYENERLPEIEVMCDEDYGEGEGVFVPDYMQDYDREDLLVEGVDIETFTRTWLAVLHEKFQPTPMPEMAH